MAGPGRKGDDRGEDVQHKRGDDQFAVADLVRDDAADDDAEAEAGEAGAADVAELRRREAELAAPVGENAAANGEADAGGKNGHETGQEQAFGVGRDSFVAGLNITHIGWGVALVIFSGSHVSLILWRNHPEQTIAALR